MLLLSGWPVPEEAAYGGRPDGGDEMWARCVNSVALLESPKAGVYEMSSMHCLSWTLAFRYLRWASQTYTYSESDKLMDTMLVILAIGSTQTISRTHASSETPSICRGVSCGAGFTVIRTYTHDPFLYRIDVSS